MTRRFAVAAWVVLCAARAVEASSGVVIDPKGQPLEGVKACYKADNVEQLCVQTDTAGAWALPPSAVDQVRLSHPAFLPRTIDGGKQPTPIILHPGAIMLVKLQDPSGQPLTQGEVDVLLPSGKRYGPFPIRNAAGTKVNSLDPGPVVILARSEGYAQTRAKESDLAAGRETVVVIQLEPEPPPD